MPTEPDAKTFADFARAEGSATLEHENPINANLRNGGIGLVPRVLGVDEQRGSATVGCGSILAMMEIPLGWHIIDDGRRVLVFDAESQVQVNFRLVDEGEADAAVLIERLLAQLAPSAGEARWLTMELEGMKTLAIRGLPIQQPGEDAVLVDQVFMYRAFPGHPTRFCEVRTTAEEAGIARALDMVELIVGSMRFAA